MIKIKEFLRPTKKKIIASLFLTIILPSLIFFLGNPRADDILKMQIDEIFMHVYFCLFVPFITSIIGLGCCIDCKGFSPIPFFFGGVIVFYLLIYLIICSIHIGYSYLKKRSG